MTRFNDLTLSQQMSKKDRFNVLADEIDANVSGDSSIASRVGDLETTVGGNDSGLVKQVLEIVAAIGDAENPAEGTILARLAALETPAGDG